MPTAVVALEGERTGDGRLIEVGALNWDNGPWPLLADHNSELDGVIGTVTALRRSGAEIVADYELDVDSDDPEVAGRARRAEDLLVEGVVGFSPRLDSEVVELRIRAEDLEEMEELERVTAEDADGDGNVVVARWDHEAMTEVVVEARIREISVVAIPAFEETAVAAAAWPIPLVASVLPRLPAAHFDRWESDGPVPVTVDDDGRMWGHAAPRGVCLRGSDGCQTWEGLGPVNLTGFNLNSLPLDDGERVRAGVLTFRNGHADTTMTAAEARAHHDNTSTVAADLVAWEDQHGLAVAGSIRPSLTADDLREVIGAGPSVEVWPNPTGGRDLLGIHLVAVQAWPVAAASGDGGIVLTSSAPVRACDSCTESEVDADGPLGVLASRVRMLEVLAGESLLASIREE